MDLLNPRKKLKIKEEKKTGLQPRKEIAHQAGPSYDATLKQNPNEVQSWQDKAASSTFETQYTGLPGITLAPLDQILSFETWQGVPMLESTEFITYQNHTKRQLAALTAREISAIGKWVIDQGSDAGTGTSGESLEENSEDSASSQTGSSSESESPHPKRISQQYRAQEIPYHTVQEASITRQQHAIRRYNYLRGALSKLPKIPARLLRVVRLPLIEGKTIYETQIQVGDYVSNEERFLTASNTNRYAIEHYDLYDDKEEAPGFFEIKSHSAQLLPSTARKGSEYEWLFVPNQIFQVQGIAVRTLTDGSKTIAVQLQEVEREAVTSSIKNIHTGEAAVVIQDKRLDSNEIPTGLNAVDHHPVKFCAQ